MKILTTRTRPLSNAEVLAHVTTLQTQYAAQNRTNRIPQNLGNILRDVCSMLEMHTQPTSSAPSFSQQPPARFLVSDPRVFVVLTRILKGRRYGLMESEVVQIFNHVPRNKEELGMLLEDVEERFGEEVLDEMVKVIGDVLVHGKGLDDVGGFEEGQSGSERRKLDEGVDDTVEEGAGQEKIENGG